MELIHKDHPLANVPLGKLGAHIRFPKDQNKNWRPIIGDGFAWKITKNSYAQLKGPWLDNCEFGFLPPYAPNATPGPAT